MFRIFPYLYHCLSTFATRSCASNIPWNLNLNLILNLNVGIFALTFVVCGVQPECSTTALRPFFSTGTKTHTSIIFINFIAAYVTIINQWPFDAIIGRTLCQKSRSKVKWFKQESPDKQTD